MTSNRPRAKVFLYPEIPDQESANRIVSRLAWYLSPHFPRLKAVVAAIDERLLANAAPAPNLDPAIKAYIGTAKQHIQITSAGALEACILAGDPKNDVFFIWDTRCEASLSPSLSDAVKAYQKNGGFYRIDPDRTRMEGSFLLWAGLNKFCDSKVIGAEQKIRMKAMLAEIGQHERAYVFGSGPSFSDFVRSHDFSDGISIIANSIVKDKDALEILRPRIICAADPIYHAGASSYAGAFRRELVDALERTGAWFVCPLRDFPIYKAFLPAHSRTRIVALPFNAAMTPPVDLSEHFYFRPYPNILTLGLLPLASTLARRISIVGCDGRKILNDSFFWSHDKKVQFNDNMADIQAAHPAFFKIDYNAYYMDHCRDLENVLAEIEGAGRVVECLTPSLIPALAHRHDATPAEGDDFSCLAILDPDAKDDWGHFLAYDKRIGSAVREAGLEFAVICRSELDARFRPDSTNHFLPTFSVNSWTIGNKPLAKRPDVLTFARELDVALERLESACKTGKICIFFYVGSMEAAEVVEHILTYRPRFRAVINFFWSYNFDHKADTYKAIWRPLVARQSRSRRISVMHSTHQIAAEFERDWSIRLPVLQHPSTTFGDHEAAALSRLPATSRSARRFGDGGYRILFPGGARKEKGFVLAVKACALLAKDADLHPILRARLDKVSGPELQRAFDSLDKAGIEVIDGELNDDEFIDMIAGSDIVVIPYFSEAFRRRTSGILVDAMLLGKPVVVLKRTWLADVVDAELTGVSVEPDAKSVAEAVRSLLARQAQFISAIERSSRTYLETNSWRALVDSVLKLAGQEAKGQGNSLPDGSHREASDAPARQALALADRTDRRPGEWPEGSGRSRILSLTAQLLTEGGTEQLASLRRLVVEANADEPSLRHAVAVIDHIERKSSAVSSVGEFIRWPAEDQYVARRHAFLREHGHAVAALERACKRAKEI